jgi:hypothetical protein
MLWESVITDSYVGQFVPTPSICSRLTTPWGLSHPTSHALQLSLRARIPHANLSQQNNNVIILPAQDHDQFKYLGQIIASVKDS